LCGTNFQFLRKARDDIRHSGGNNKRLTGNPPC
jgi:hypothetical protein